MLLSKSKQPLFRTILYYTRGQMQPLKSTFWNPESRLQSLLTSASGNLKVLDSFCDFLLTEVAWW